MDRTIIVQLKPTPEQAHILQQTFQDHTSCFNAVATIGFDTGCSKSTMLHKLTYYPLRAQYPDLPSQLVCAARVKAAEAVTSALTWKKKHAANYPKKVAKAEKAGRKPPIFKPVKAPISICAPIRYDARSYWVKWADLTCSLASVAGRQKIPFLIPKHARQYIGWTVCSADLCFRQGRYFLHIVVSQSTPLIERTEEVIGVDLGLNRPAVTSKRDFLGDRRWKEQERRIFRLRRTLQKKGTTSAKRHLKKLSGQRFRQRRDHDHVLSKRIVQHAAPGSTIAVENLKNIRETSKIGRGKKNKNVSNKRRFHSWSFAQFQRFLAYKAEARGIQVVKVNPAYTSQTCSRCGHVAKKNRPSQSLFLCKNCGYCLNADLHASYTIRDRHVSTLASVGTPSLVGRPVKRPIVSAPRGSGTSSRL